MCIYGGGLHALAHVAGLEALASEAKEESHRASVEVMELLRETLRPAITRLDTNADGTVSDAEAFDFFDTNHDTVISPDELRNGLTALGVARALMSALIMLTAIEYCATRFHCQRRQPCRLS